MTFKIKHLLSALCLLHIGTISAQSTEAKAALAQLKPRDYPTKPIEISVGAAAGGGMDITARIIAKKLEEYTDARFIVVNKPGAGGMIHNAWLATQAPKEGYQIGLITNTIVGHSYLNAAGKWSYRDVENLAYVNQEPIVWLTSATGKYASLPLEKILEKARDKSDPVKIGVMTGTMYEMIAEQVERAAKVEFVKAPFAGGSPSLVALMGNHIDISFGFISEFAPLGEKVRPIAVASDKPAANLPGVPTFNQSLRGGHIEWILWRYLVAPKGIAPDRKTWLLRAIQEVLNDQQLIADLTKRGANMDRKELNTPEATTRELERIAEAERRFYIESGRLKN
jgi:tripartite-type tricarboxylate transporter receptor subunit TctC